MAPPKMEGVESGSERASSRGSSSGRGRTRGKRNKAPLRDASRCKIVALDAAHAEPGLLAKIATTTVAPATAAALASAAACVAVSAAATTTGGTFVALASTVKSCSDNEWRGNGDVAAEMGDIRQTPVPSGVSYAATAARGAHLVASPAQAQQSAAEGRLEM